MCLYSTDTAFTQHQQDKYSSQTKTQKPADNNIFERHVKFRLSRGRIRGTRNSRTISIDYKNGVHQDRACASSRQWPFKLESLLR